MKPIEQLSNGMEDPTLERMEEVLRSAAAFEPDTEATYNFAAAAMVRRRFRSRAAWMTVAGCACTALLVWFTVPRVLGPSGVYPLPIFSQPAGSTMDEAPSGSAVNGFKLISESTAERMGFDVPFQPRQSAPRFADRSESMARPVANRTTDEADDEAALPAKWEKETVDRYATGLIKPTLVEERKSDGSRVYKPAMAVIPINSDERPASEDSKGMDMISISNPDTLQGEGTE